MFKNIDITIESKFQLKLTQNLKYHKKLKHGLHLIDC